MKRCVPRAPQPNVIVRPAKSPILFLFIGATGYYTTRRVASPFKCRGVRSAALAKKKKYSTVLTYSALFAPARWAGRQRRCLRVPSRDPATARSRYSRSCFVPGSVEREQATICAGAPTVSLECLTSSPWNWEGRGGGGGSDRPGRLCRAARVRRAGVPPSRHTVIRLVPEVSGRALFPSHHRAARSARAQGLCTATMRPFISIVRDGRCNPTRSFGAERGKNGCRSPQWVMGQGDRLIPP